jgi:23S rRNA (cytosine1962-C5)-methyltransferase
VTETLSEIRLFPGRERSVVQRHPWIYSGAIEKVLGDPASGDTVSVVSHKGERLGKAAFSPFSQIRARMWSWNPEEQVDHDFFQAKVENSIAFRQELRKGLDSNAIRLVYAESDGLPGLIVDDYAGHLVVQILSSGCELWKRTLLQVLIEAVHPLSVYERSDVEVRHLEGLQPCKGMLWGKDPPDQVVISEAGNEFLVDIKQGQKTGFFLDQRRNRREILPYIKGRDFLNCFCYSGAFTVYALRGGATHTVSIDSSADALALAKRNLEVNGFSPDKEDFLDEDVFQQLRRFRDARRQFDVIVLDPPKFAATQAQVPKASRAYKDINLLALKLLRPGGILLTFSCSGGVSMELFQKIVAGAALDAGVETHVIKYLGQDADHPISLRFPESAYLKGLICRTV